MTDKNNSGNSYGINRRDFNKGLLGLSAAGALGGGLILPQHVRAAEPKKGGRLRVAGYVQSPKDTMDPAKCTFHMDYMRMHTFFNGLTRLDESLTPQPELAESFEPNADASEWTFTLRSGVTFHNGKTLDANDVVFSLNRHLDEKVGSSAASLLSGVTSITADGNNVVKVSLDSPNADLPVALGTFHFMIVPVGTEDMSKGIGTGPFQVAEFKPGVRTLGKRNDNYWKKDAGPYLDEIELFAINDETARLNALISGDVHMALQINPKAAGRVNDVKGVELFETKSGQFADLVTMVDRAPSNNLDLQLALKYLQNREKILKKIYNGFGAIGNDIPIDPTNPFYCHDIAQRSFDLDKAKHHIKKSGINKIEISVANAAATGAVEQALFLQRNAARAGLTIDVKKVPEDGYWSHTWIKKPFHYAGWNPRPTADIMFTLSLHSQADWNESRWKNARFDELLKAQRSQTDLAKRKEMFCEMQQLVHEEAGRVIPVFLSYIDAVSSNLKGLKQIPVGNVMGFNFADSVWLDA